MVTDPGERARWGRRTFGPAFAVGAILRPGSCDDISAALRIATEFAVPIHPVSRGANWGLGSRAPTQPGAVILDLSRMTAIADYDPEQGLVRVEPGVTFQSLADYLAARNSRFFVPEIGGSPEASVLANALDRGDGAIGDRWASLGDLTVALPDGRFVETGFSAAGAHRLRGLHAAAGPIADGLFSQSNLGVVAGAAVRLEPMPGNLAVITGRVDSLGALPGLIAAWREAQIAGAIRGRSVTMWNGVKFLARDKPRAAYEEADIRQAESETWLMSGYLEAETGAMLSLRSAWALQRLRAAGGTVSGAVVRTGGNWTV